MKNMFIAALLALSLAACGSRVEVPPAFAGKIMTKDGYQPAVIPPSKFRLSPCMAYCDKLVVLDTSDKAKTEDLVIFMPQDKLNLRISIRTTMSVNPKETNSLFSTLPPSGTMEDNDRVSYIAWDQIYNTYAQQVILTEAREYISKYTISQISSSMEKVNADLRVILQKRIEERTPFTVRYVGITNVKYPDIITQAQENAAQRREQVQQEEAQLQISRVKLERELEETRLTRQIELEKSQIEAKSQQILRDVVDDKVLTLKRLENEKAWIDTWNGQLPNTVVGNEAGMILNLPQK